MTPRLRGFAAAGLLVSVALSGCSAQQAPISGAQDPEIPSRDDLSAGLSEPVTDSLYPDFGHANIDVLHYGLSLDYQPDTQVISGSVALTIRPVEDASELALDFSDAMSIDKITVDGKEVEFTLESYDLTVNTPMSADEQVEVVVSYEGVPETIAAPAERGDMTGGIGASVDPATGALWAFQEPYGALTWYPSNDQPSDEALYDFAITVPDGYSAVASGTFVGQEGNTFQWSSSDPVASYLATIAVDKYELTEMTGPAGLPITVWIPPQYQSFTPILERMPEMLDWLTEHYGPYPFDSAGVVLVGGDSAMETQQMVTFSGGMADIPGASDDYITGVVVHELAHQWFGDAVTPQDWSGLWLNEGAATYAEQMWNVDAGVVDEDSVVSDWEVSDPGLRRDYGPPGSPDPGAFASSNSYVCPALMLYNLREKLGGPEEVDSLLAAWVSEYTNKSVSREDFIKFANEHSGKDLTKYFDEWLDSNTTPE